ncbi:MAG: dihydrofolate reductase family protein, partial [Myxococcota bacterium]|nr:dihydrofolate reductase family protein [Myxococcota bacterium]
SEARERALVATGAEVWRCAKHRNGRIDVQALATRLGDANIQSVLVEGGGEVHAYLLEKRLADELVIYIAPKIVGGPAKSWVGGKGLASIAAAHRYVFDGAPVNLDGDLRITAVRAADRRLPDDPMIDD